MIDINSIPAELMEKREVIECNWIMNLYKDVGLVSDYPNIVNTEDIITQDGIFYYGLVCNMAKAGYSVADNASIYAYLADKKELMARFEEYGGYKTIQEITNLLNPDNIDVYYDELVKSNLLIRLHEKGFGVLKELDKLKQMNSSEVYDYYEYLLSDTSVGKIEKIQPADLSSGYEKWIDEWDKGLAVGIPIGSSAMNYMTAGVHTDNLMLHLAGIGQGKTTTSVLLYILPAIVAGESVLIICNEQTESEFRQMLIVAVMYNYVKKYPKGLSRAKMIRGHFTDEQKDALNEAAKWLEEQKGKVTYVPMDDYDVPRMKKVIQKYSKLGYREVLIDTLKPDDDASERAWGLFNEAAKSLFMLAKKTHTAIVCTAQLAPDSMNRKYLDLTSVGKSRGISETATVVSMFRPVHTDEYDKIHPYQWKKNPDGSDNKKIKVTIDLNPDEHYIIMFIPKNRWGQVQPQIVMKFNQNLLQLEDVGYYDAPFDNFTRR